MMAHLIHDGKNNDYSLKYAAGSKIKVQYIKIQDRTHMTIIKLS